MPGWLLSGTSSAREGEDAAASGATGTLSTAVTHEAGDIAEFTSLVVAIEGICLGEDTSHAADPSDNAEQAYDGVDTGSERTYVEINESTHADREPEVPAGTYRFCTCM